MDSCVVSKCPFCGFDALGGAYEMLLHLELHSEGRSPFIPDDEDDEKQYSTCPLDGCSQHFPLAEMADHLDAHAEQEATVIADWTTQVGQETSRPDPRSQEPSPGPGTAEQWKGSGSMPGTNRKGKLKQMVLGTAVTSPASSAGGQPTQAVSATKKRLGISELGIFAYEKHMPPWLHSLLQRGDLLTLEGVIPVLRERLQQNKTTEYAYLCHPCVQQVFKLRREGQFCGYRNIQMVTSYITGTGCLGAEIFHGELPSIFKIQDFIELAWDLGFNPHGRIETGGIKGTRKHIGTPEAQAVFCSLGIPCDVQAFKHTERGVSGDLLLQAVERYFRTGASGSSAQVRQTLLPPIYFQTPRHSMTIVGLEKQRHLPVNLLVFDPIYHDKAHFSNMLKSRLDRQPAEVLNLYRRGTKSFCSHREFEVLTLSHRLPGAIT